LRCRKLLTPFCVGFLDFLHVEYLTVLRDDWVWLIQRNPILTDWQDLRSI